MRNNTSNASAPNPPATAKHTINIVDIARGVRTALDTAAPGLAFAVPLFSSESSSSDPNTTATIPTTPTRLAWTITEAVFFLIMIGYIITRYVVNRDGTTNDKSANNILTMRIIITVCSGVATGLLASDLEGETYRSLAGILLIAINSFMVDASQEKFEKSTNSSRLGGELYTIPEGKSLNLAHELLVTDIAIMTHSLVNQFSEPANEDPDASITYALKRSTRDNETLFVTPPIAKDPENTRVRYHNGAGYNNIGLYFDSHQITTLDRSIFDDIENLNNTTDHRYKILMLARGYVPDQADLWSTIEVNILRRQGDANENHFDITIYNHSPLGVGQLSPEDYYTLAKVIYNKLHNQIPGGYGVAPTNIHFKKTQPDQEFNIEAAIAAENAATDAAPFDLTQYITTNDMLTSSFANARITATNTNHSCLVALQDLDNLLNNKPLFNDVYSSQALTNYKQRAIMRTLQYPFNHENFDQFENRVVTMPTRAVTVVAAHQPTA